MTCDDGRRRSREPDPVRTEPRWAGRRGRASGPARRAGGGRGPEPLRRATRGPSSATGTGRGSSGGQRSPGAGQERTGQRVQTKLGGRVEDGHDDLGRLFQRLVLVDRDHDRGWPPTPGDGDVLTSFGDLVQQLGEVVLSDEPTLAAIRRGLDDLAAGEVVALDEVRSEHAARDRS
jgi:hypothetical protein